MVQDGNLDKEEKRDKLTHQEAHNTMQIPRLSDSEYLNWVHSQISNRLQLRLLSFIAATGATIIALLGYFGSIYIENQINAKFSATLEKEVKAAVGTILIDSSQMLSILETEAGKHLKPAARSAINNEEPELRRMVKTSIGDYVSSDEVKELLKGAIGVAAKPMIEDFNKKATEVEKLYDSVSKDIGIISLDDRIKKFSKKVEKIFEGDAFSLSEKDLIMDYLRSFNIQKQEVAKNPEFPYALEQVVESFHGVELNNEMDEIDQMYRNILSRRDVSLLRMYFHYSLRLIGNQGAPENWKDQEVESWEYYGGEISDRNLEKTSGMYLAYKMAVEFIKNGRVRNDVNKGLFDAVSNLSSVHVSDFRLALLRFSNPELFSSQGSTFYAQVSNVFSALNDAYKDEIASLPGEDSEASVFLQLLDLLRERSKKDVDASSETKKTDSTDKAQNVDSN